MSRARLIRLGEVDRVPISFRLDGRAVQALAGDTVLTAILTNQSQLRQSEFGGGGRAGFCLMGACQDCWVWTEQGGRLRACDTTIEPEMALLTQAPEGEIWPQSAL